MCREVENCPGVRTVLFDLGVESGLATAPNVLALHALQALQAPAQAEPEGEHGESERASKHTRLDAARPSVPEPASVPCGGGGGNAGASGNSLDDVGTGNVGSWQWAKEAERCAMFESALPIPDHDHGLHHVLCTIHSHFASWSWFSAVTSALCSFFSNSARLDSFVVKVIWRNVRIPENKKPELARLFSTRCPTMLPSRWHYLSEVLEWLDARRLSIRVLWRSWVQLEEGSEKNSRDSEFTEKEFNQISLVAGESPEALKYWLMFAHCLPFTRWGRRISSWLHGCPCHEADLMQKNHHTVCKLKGRRASEFSGWKYWQALAVLKALPVPPINLAQTDASTTSLLDSLREEYLVCRAAMALRFQQSFSFWEDLPWAVVRLYQGHLPVSTESPDFHDTGGPLQRARDAARELLNRYDSANSAVRFGPVADFFFGTGARSLRSLVERFADGEDVNSAELAPLFHSVRDYSSALLVMQMLESRHHLASQSICRGRASTPAATCADIRRSVNRGEVESQEFRELLPQLMAGIPYLLPPHLRQCARPEFVAHVYGYHSASQFSDVSTEAAAVVHFKSALSLVSSKTQCAVGSSIGIDTCTSGAGSGSEAAQVGAAAGPEPAPAPAPAPSAVPAPGSVACAGRQSNHCPIERALQLEYLRAALKAGDYLLAVGTPAVTAAGSCLPQNRPFQLISLDPGRKHYIQKTAFLSEDPWNGAVAAVACLSADWSEDDQVWYAAARLEEIHACPLEPLADLLCHQGLYVFQNISIHVHFVLPSSLQQELRQTTGTGTTATTAITSIGASHSYPGDGNLLPGHSRSVPSARAALLLCREALRMQTGGQGFFLAPVASAAGIPLPQARHIAAWMVSNGHWLLDRVSGGGASTYHIARHCLEQRVVLASAVSVDQRRLRQKVPRERLCRLELRALLLQKGWTITTSGARASTGNKTMRQSGL